MPNIGIKSSFHPVADANTRIVILGSLPGETSLEKQQYYARPTNQFWRLIGAVLEHDLVSMPYDEKLATLKSHRVGLWDVIKAAYRTGSSDGAIRDMQPNPLSGFTAQWPNLRALAFNGGKSLAIGQKQLAADHGYKILKLPSSSAAYCTMSFSQKLEKWLGIREFID